MILHPQEIRIWTRVDPILLVLEIIQVLIRTQEILIILVTLETATTIAATTIAATTVTLETMTVTSN